VSGNTSASATGAATVDAKADEVKNDEGHGIQPNRPAEGSNLLEGIVVKKPESAASKTRKYLCSIKDETPFGTLDLQIAVGPVVFCRKTFAWEGVGPEATQIPIRGAVYELSDEQVELVRSKLRFRYIRPARSKTGDGKMVMTGVEDIDASDSDPVNPKLLPGRLRGDEVPLHTILVFERVHTVAGLKGKAITLEEAKKIVADAEADNDRDLEGPEAAFAMESGRGGKAPGKLDPRDAKTQKALSTTDGKREAKAGLIQ